MNFFIDGMPVLPRDVRVGPRLEYIKQNNTPLECSHCDTENKFNLA